MMMSQPYIGLFAEGAEQWCKKVGFGAPEFNTAEKKYYSELRCGHKLYELAYSEYLTRLIDKLNISDRYFYHIRNLRAIITGYYNVGTDLCNGQYCGNTVLCALYSPVDTLNVKDIGPYIRDMSVVAGKLAGFFYCDKFPPFEFNDMLMFYKADTGELIHKCRKCAEEGGDVPYRDGSADMETVGENALRRVFEDVEDIGVFITMLREQNGRYANSQMNKIVSLAKAYTADQVETAIRYCMREKKCSLNEIQAYLLYRYGIGIGKRKMSENAVYHCKKRAEEIAEEQHGRLD